MLRIVQVVVVSRRQFSNNTNRPTRRVDRCPAPRSTTAVSAPLRRTSSNPYLFPRRGN
jgi:hypothetical protein